MNLKVSKEKITSAEIVFSDTNEQSIELDYILPDYYPEIFRILKCITTPQITFYNIDGTKLTYEMSVSIRILYCAENSNAVHTITQKLTYSKKTDIGKCCTNPQITITPQINFANCRAVNPRRIDIRGAVSTIVSVSGLQCKELISDIEGGNIQLKRMSLTYPSEHLNTSKTITVSEKFDIGMSKPSIIDIIRSDAIVTSIDKKVIADKIIVKGDLCINMLYTCQKDNYDIIEPMQFTLPFSQVIDFDGIDDRFECNVNTDVLFCEITPCSDGDGNTKIAECSVNILISCSAFKPTTAEFVVDEYSTSYTTLSEKSNFLIETAPNCLDNVFVTKSTISSTDNELECIYDAWCTVKSFSVNLSTEEKCIILNGTNSYIILAKNKEGNPLILEKEELFTANIPLENINNLSQADIKLIPLSCSYTLSSDSTIELKSEIRISGYIKNYISINGITDITLNEDEPINHKNNYALKIYYTNDNEDLWEIAKKYNTSVSAIIEENEIEDDMITGCGMILIPIV